MKVTTYKNSQLFITTYQILRARVRKTLHQFDMMPTSWVLLCHIYHAKEGIPSAEIARRLKVKAPLVTHITQDFSKRGLVKQASHPTDQRVKLLAITEEGSKLVLAIEEQVTKDLEGLIKGVSPHDMDIFRKVLETIIQNDEQENLR